MQREELSAMEAAGGGMMATTRKQRVGYSIAMRRKPTCAEYKLHKHLRWMRNHVGKKGKQLLIYTRQKLKREYILDFYFLRCGLCVEIDGASHSTKKRKEYDMRRDERLADIGIKTIRFTNEEVMKDVRGVADKIYKETIAMGLLKWKGTRHLCRKKLQEKYAEPPTTGPSTIRKMMAGLSNDVDAK